MNLNRIFLVAGLVIILGPVFFAQLPGNTSSGTITEVTDEQRKKAFLKLLEGQRHLLTASGARTQSEIISAVRASRDAFEAAVENDPTLAEAYTALAEISITSPPNDIDEGLKLALSSVRANPDNFGGQRLVARLSTFKSRIRSGNPDRLFVKQAIDSWHEVIRLDLRNAEAWAFLSELYQVTGRQPERVNALRKWTSASPPLEGQFYQLVMGRGEDLSPEAASLKLGAALIEIDQYGEAAEVLVRLIGDNGANQEAIDLLADSVAVADRGVVEKLIEPLQSAAFADSTNLSLIILLSNAEERLGRIAAARKVLLGGINSDKNTDPELTSLLLVELGDLYLRDSQYSDGVIAYQRALEARSIGKAGSVNGVDREFATQVYSKIVRAYQDLGKIDDAVSIIEKARSVFGKDDLFADRQLITIYRETKQSSKALEIIRSLRQTYPADESFRRLQASIMTEMGLVDDAVALMREVDLSIGSPETAGLSVNGDKTQSRSATTFFDKFSNILFISSLYSSAGRGKEAALAAEEAVGIANTAERKQIARLTLASALQGSGEFELAEKTLRELLKQTPGNPIALNNLGYFLVERDERLNEALELIKAAISIDPVNPSYLDSLGWAHFKLGKLDEAEMNLRSALRFDNSSGTINEHLGDVLLKKGDKTGARNSWKKAVELYTLSTDLDRVREKLEQ